MGKVIVISGASSGFGALSARALADDGSEVVSVVAGRIRLRSPDDPGRNLTLARPDEV